MAEPNPSEMEEFQRLSDRYQPDVEGPLVSQKLPITEVVAEYAQADPTFVTKTRALAGIYDHYRRIKGDGQCGWRATVFGYFELLASAGDVSLLEVEEIRIRSFRAVMDMAGVDYDLLVDMFDNTWDLFAAIKKVIQNNTGTETVVSDILNDQVVSESIVYHFKMMTSSYMALHADDYEPFLEISLDEYRQTRIDPTNQEIDQIGLQALTTGVIAPAGIGLEVLYLDRSEGDAVTPYAFVPDAQDKANIRLLYRPGHYDIIYKNNSPITVMLQWQSESIRAGDDFEQPADLYSYMFPDSAYETNPPPDTFPGPSNLPQYDRNQNDHVYSPQFQFDPRTNTTHYDPEMAQQPYSTQPSPVYPQQPYHVPIPQQEYCSASQDAYNSSSSSPPLPTSVMQPVPAANEPQIRLNANMFKADWRNYVAVPMSPSTSDSTSLNNIWNTNFQPEIWRPQNDYNK